MKNIQLAATWTYQIGEYEKIIKYSLFGKHTKIDTSRSACKMVHFGESNLKLSIVLKYK